MKFAKIILESWYFDGNMAKAPLISFRDVDKTIEPNSTRKCPWLISGKTIQLLAVLRMFGVSDSHPKKAKDKPIMDMDSTLANSVVLNTENMKLNKAKDVQQNGAQRVSNDQIHQFCLSKMRNSELSGLQDYSMKPFQGESAGSAIAHPRLFRKPTPVLNRETNWDE